MVQAKIFYFNIRKKSIERKNFERLRRIKIKDNNYNKKGKARYQWSFSKAVPFDVSDVCA